MKRLAALSLALLLAVGLVGCGDDKQDTASNDTTTTAGSGSTADSGGGDALKLSDSDYGKILTTSDRMTLYMFTPDTADKSACNSGCSSAWPPVEGPATPGDGLDAGDFGVITRDDGSKQATFYGHPLYRYSADSAPGDVTGEGSGDKWYVIDAEGNPVKEKASAAPGSGTSGTTGDSGY